MSVASQLAANKTYKVRLLFFIDGIPFVFGSAAGITHSGTGITNPPSSLVSVDGIVADSVSMGGQELDRDALIVRPGSLSLSIRGSTTWDKYFERRRTPQMRLGSDVTETATTFTVDNTAGISVGDYLYCNRETMKVTTVTSDTELELARNQCALAGSAGAVHLGGDNGALVSVSPRFFLGRQAALWIAHGDSSELQQIGMFRMSAAPEWDGKRGVWKLNFSDNMKAFDRKVALGMKGSKLISDTSYLSGSWYRRLEPEDLREFGPSDELGHVLVSHSEERYVNNISLAPIESLPSVYVQVYANEMYTTVTGVSMKRVAVFDTYPLRAALKLMLSDRGQGDNHATYDVLFGITSTGSGATGRLESGELECRLGAAVPAALVDVTGIEASVAFNKAAEGFFCVIGMRGEENLLDYLEEFAWHAGGVWYVTDAGKLSFKAIEAVYPDDVAQFTITESDIALDTDLIAVDDERDIVCRVKISCNVPAYDDKPLTNVTAVYQQEAETYRESTGAMALTRKTLVLNVPLPDGSVESIYGRTPGSLTTLDGLSTKLERIFQKRSSGLRRYKLVLPWKFAQLAVGDRVTVTHSKLRAFDGSSVSGITFDVTGVERDLKQFTITATIEETWSAPAIAPVARISSWNAGTKTATLTTGSGIWGGSTTPGRQFAAGWYCKIFDSSAATRYSVSEQLLISSVTDTTIVFTTVPSGFTPAVNDIISLSTYDSGVSSSTANTAGIAPSNMAWMAQVPPYNVLGSTLDPPKTWG